MSRSVLKTAWRLRDKAHTRVGTAALNKALAKAQEIRAPRVKQGRRGQIYFGTQVEVSPPTFLLFVNDPDLFESAYMRFLENRFREELPFTEIPIKLILKPRPRSPSKNA